MKRLVGAQKRAMCADESSRHICFHSNRQKCEFIEATKMSRLLLAQFNLLHRHVFRLQAIAWRLESRDSLIVNWDIKSVTMRRAMRHATRLVFQQPILHRQHTATNAFVNIYPTQAQAHLCRSNFSHELLSLCGLSHDDWCRWLRNYLPISIGSSTIIPPHPSVVCFRWTDGEKISEPKVNLICSAHVRTYFFLSFRHSPSSAHQWNEEFHRNFVPKLVNTEFNDDSALRRSLEVH